MNGYSKIKTIGTTTDSSISMDLSDILSSSASSSSFPHHHQPPKAHTQTPETETFHKKATKPEEFSASSEQEPGSNFGGVKLSRATSVSVALQAAVKRAFSMQRSSSVSDRYCRIHDQSVTLASPSHGIYYEDHPGKNNERYLKKKKKKNSRTKFLKACKRFLRP